MQWAWKYLITNIDKINLALVYIGIAYLMSSDFKFIENFLTDALKNVVFMIPFLSYK